MSAALSPRVRALGGVAAVAKRRKRVLRMLDWEARMLAARDQGARAVAHHAAQVATLLDALVEGRADVARLLLPAVRRARRAAAETSMMEEV